MFRFTLVDNENAESLGAVTFVRPDFKEADVIPQGQGRSLRVVKVLEPTKPGTNPVLVVGLIDGVRASD